MKFQANPFLRTASFVAALTLSLSAIPAHAVSLYWDGTSTTGNADGGNGTWGNGVTSNWDTAATGGSDSVWTNGGNTAVFGGTAGTVTLGSDISVGSMTMDTPGYEFTSTGPQTLTFQNALPGEMAQLFTGGLALKWISNQINSSILTNTANTFSGGITVGSSGNNDRFLLGNTTIGAGTPGALTSGVWGTGALTLGVTANDLTQIMFNGAATINNAIIVNSARGNADAAGTFRVDSTGNVFNGTLTANLANATFRNDGGTGAVTVNGEISGAFGLMLSASNGTGLTITLANTGTANSYAGGTTLSSVNETLTLGAADQIPNGTGTGNLINNGTFNMGGFSETINGLTGTGTVDGISGTPTLTVGDNNATGTFSGAIKNTAGTLALTKIGTGTQTLSGANTYDGATQVDAGLLVFANTAAKAAGIATTLAAGSIGLGVGAGSGDYSVANVADLFNTNTLAGFDLVAGSGVALDTTAGDFDQTTGLTAARAFTKLGSNTLTLSGTNTYSGTTTISAGTLMAGSTTALATTGAFSIAAGATLDLGGFNNTIMGLATATGTITDSTGAATLKISTMATTAQLFTGSLALQWNANQINSSILSNTGNDFSGGITAGGSTGINNRFLLNGQTIGSGTPGALTSGVWGTGAVTLGTSPNEWSQIMFQGAATINNAIVVNTALGNSDAAGAFRVDSSGCVIAGEINANLADASFRNAGSGAGEITVSGVISGNSGLTLLVGNGTGTLNVTLTEDNTYTGDTTVNAGTLRIDKPYLANASDIIMGATGKLDLNFDESGGAVTDTVASLTINGVPQAAGIYGATGSGATTINNTNFAGVGTLTVTNSGSPYTTWASGFPGFTPTTGTLDFENDGIQNLLEFVLGGNPTTNDSPSIRPTVNASGSDLVVTFKRTDLSETQPVTVKVQTSPDLVTWTNFATIGATSGSGYTVAENAAAADTIVVTIPKAAATKKFARVAAE
jgi:autotransporter-associated beta strand protein